MTTTALNFLIRQGVNAGELRTLVFDPVDRREVLLFRRRTVRKPPYPSLRDLRTALEETCWKDRSIQVECPKRIWFFSDRINFEFDNADGEPELTSYRIDGGVLFHSPPPSLRRKARNWSVAFALLVADMYSHWCCMLEFALVA